MSLRTIDVSIRDERGVALPLTVIVLAVLASLTIAFIAMSATEPQIAANLVLGDQALALAEAGVEDSMWALTNPGASGIVFPGAIPARYAGGTFIGLGTANTGGYTVAIVPNGTSANVTATGWIPNNVAPQAKRIVTVTLSQAGLGNFVINLPAAFAAKGQIDVSNSAHIDAENSAGSSCGSKVGTYSYTATNILNSAKIWGADGNGTANQATDYKQNQPAASFDPFTLTQSQLDTLKAMAKAQGSYYQGSVTFDDKKAPPNGVVFVDTVSGNPIGNPVDPADLAQVTLSSSVHGSGWLVVMGSITVSGSVHYAGLVYAVNDFKASGSFHVDGAVATMNVVDTVKNVVDSEDVDGSVHINFDCNAINNGLSAGTATAPWKPTLGTWREQAG